MEWLSNIPALIKIFLVLGIAIIGLKFRLHLSISLFIGCICLGFLFQMSPENFLNATISGILSLETLSLVIIVAGILVLSNGMSLSGRLEKIVDSFKKLVGESRITLVTFPALIGLLPMPGGAVFSAPMVGAVSQNSTLLPHHKTIINYWFRHIWEYWFPLYPGVILALSLTNVPAWKFITLNCPMTLIAIGIGYIILLRNVSLGDKKHRNYSVNNIKDFIYQLIPIFLMLFSMLFIGILINIIEKKMNFKSKFMDRLPIFIGLVLSISWVLIIDKLSWKNIKTIFLNKTIWQLGFLVIVIMVFRSILEKSGGVITLKDELLTYNIPINVLIMILPLITGIVTGIAVGFVGTSFPVVITLISTMNIAVEHTGSLIFISYVFGYIGMMLSPVHLCLLLTKDYFKANLAKVYTKYLIPISTLSIISALILYFVYKYFQF